MKSLMRVIGPAKYFWVYFVAVYFISLSGTLASSSPQLIVPVQMGRTINLMSIQQSKYLLVFGQNNTQVWESRSGRLIKTLKVNAIRGVESPDGKTLLLVKKHMIYFVDPSDFKVSDSLYLLGLEYVSFLPEPKKLLVYAANTKGALYTVNLEPSWRPYDTIFVNRNTGFSQVRSFGATPDGKYTLLQFDKSPAFYVDNHSKQVLKTFDAGMALYLFTPDFKICEIITEKKNIRLSIINPRTFEVERTLLGLTNIEPQYLSKTLWLDRDRLLIYNQEMRTVADFRSGTVGPDYKYYSDYHSIDITRAAKVEQGVVRSVYIAISYPVNRVEEWDLASNRKLRDIGLNIASPLHVAVAPDAFRMQFGSEYEIELGRTVRFMRVNAKNPISAYTPDGNQRIHAGMMGIVEMFNSKEQNAQPKAFISHEMGIRRAGSGIITGKNGKLGAVISTEGVYIFDVKTMTLKHDVKINEEGFLETEVNLATFFDNDRKIIAKGIFPGNSPKTYCVEVATGKILWQIGGNYTHFKETTQGIMCFDHTEKNLKWLNPINGQVSKTQYLWNVYFGPNDVRRIAISPDANQVIFTSSNKIFFWDTKSQKVTLPKSNPTQGWINTISYFAHNPRYAVSVSNDGRSVLWDCQNMTSLATLFLIPRSNDWVCLAPDGRFDASASAMQMLYYTIDMDIVPLEQVYEAYYTPGLLLSLLYDNQEPPDDPDNDIKNLKRPPVVKLLFENMKRNLVVDDEMPTYNTDQSTARLVVEAAAPDDFVAEIRLFHNGKLVSSATRNLEVADDDAQSLQKTFQIELLPGSNIFRAVALNSQRTESKPDEINVVYKASGDRPKPDAGRINLYALVIGIDIYKNPRYNLNYATADATAFAIALQEIGGSVYKDIKIKLLTNELATKEGIIREFNNIKLQATPQDVFLFYYAGHGVLSGMKDFFLVPHEITQMYGNDQLLMSGALGVDLLQELSKKLPAQKQLFILDACQSGGAVELIAMRGLAEEKAIAQLARSTGTYWLAASGSEQFASEFAQLGHGTFTYALLNGLRGKADNGDKSITVKEIDAYLQLEVPEITRKYKGSPQYPSSYGFGNDFPLGVIK